MQLRDKLKYKILSMCEDSEPYNKIAKKVGVSKSIMSRTIKKYDTYNTIKHLESNGIPMVIDEGVKEHILGTLTEKPKLSLRKMLLSIKEKFDINVSHIKIKRFLYINNIFAYTPVSKPLLKDVHIKQRFEAAKRIMVMSKNKIKKIIFSKKCKFNFFYIVRKVFVWRESGSGLKLKNLNKTLKHGKAPFFI